jgi:hypothetical protein
MKKYYLHNGTENIGPFDTDELKTKAITKNTEVWCEGMEDWRKAGEVDELRSAIAVVPPPIKSFTTPQLIQTPPIQENKQQIISESKKTSWGKIIAKSIVVTFLIILSIGFIADYSNKSNGSDTYKESIMTIGEMEAADPATYLNATGTYKPTFLGDQLKINGIIENKATVTNYKDVVIEVIFYSKTQSEIARESYTIYDFFGPNTKKEFKLKVKNYSNVETIGLNVESALLK